MHWTLFRTRNLKVNCLLWASPLDDWFAGWWSERGIIAFVSQSHNSFVFESILRDVQSHARLHPIRFRCPAVLRAPDMGGVNRIAVIGQMCMLHSHCTYAALNLWLKTPVRRGTDRCFACSCNVWHWCTAWTLNWLNHSETNRHCTLITLCLFTLYDKMSYAMLIYVECFYAHDRLHIMQWNTL